MSDIEKRAREPNPNVAVIHEAMQHFPEGSWMRGALDHAAAELAVLHGRCQRSALKPPEGYVLVPVEPTEAMLQEIHLVKSFTGEAMHRRYAAMIAARPEMLGD